MLLWALTENSKLPIKANKIINSSENVIFYSVVSVWETMIKHMRRPENLNVSPSELVHYCEGAKMKCLTLNIAHIFTLETLSRPEDAPPHKDPFDRILISQAKSEHMTFLTHDDLLPFYNEDCIMYV